MEDEEWMGQESGKQKEKHKTGTREEWGGGRVLETLVKWKNKKEEKQCTRIDLVTKEEEEEVQADGDWKKPVLFYHYFTTKESEVEKS